MTSHTDLFEVKGDAAKAITANNGMVRSPDIQDDYSLVIDGPLFARIARLLTKATRPPTSYPPRNWMLAAEGTPADRTAAYARFRRSAFRHMWKWMCGWRDEDHASQVFFNLNGAELVRDRQIELGELT